MASLVPEHGNSKFFNEITDVQLFKQMLFFFSNNFII